MSDTDVRREAMKQEAEMYAFRFEAYAIEREIRRARDREQWLNVILPGIMRRAARERYLNSIGGSHV